MVNAQTCAMDGHMTKNMHEPFFGELAMYNSHMTYSASMQAP